MARTVPTLWIVAADRSAARLFSADWPTLENFHELPALINPQGTLQGHEMYPDRFGRDHAPDGHGFTDAPATDIRHYTADSFAQQIARHLEEARTHNEFGHLAIVAPPLMLGALRRRYSATLQRLIEAELGKELVHATGQEILRQIRQAFQNATAAVS